MEGDFMEYKWMELEAILMDWGGVMIEDPSPGMRSFLCRRFGVPSLDGVWNSEEMESFQRGTLDEAVLWSQVSERAGVRIDVNRSHWKDAFLFAYRPRESMFRRVAGWRNAGLRTALLSNTELAALPFLREAEYSCFEHMIVSCEEGCVKPDLRIYQRASGLLGVMPERCLFVDDKEVNVQGARKAGMHAHHFRTESELEECLRGFHRS
jgi:HAD superfamily hydrolase (TIGR01493 family)